MKMTETVDVSENTNQNANTPRVSETGEPEEEERTTTPLDTNLALRCVLKNDVERFTKCFEDEEDPFKELINDQINERDDEGKSPLDIASILGRLEMLKELLTRGADVHNTTGTGYSSLHFAAAWGKISCLKSLVDSGGDIQLKTRHGERPRETAVRYSQTECVDFLDWAEAKQTLTKVITSLQETMADPEKVQGRLSREEKNSTLNLIKEKLEWVEAATEATTQDFITQRIEFEETVAPILQKLSEPLPEKPEKK